MANGFVVEQGGGEPQRADRRAEFVAGRVIAGLLNQILSFFGIQGPRWFFDPAWAKNGLILLTVWVAGDVVIIYLGALQVCIANPV